MSNLLPVIKCDLATDYYRMAERFGGVTIRLGRAGQLLDPFEVAPREAQLDHPNELAVHDLVRDFNQHGSARTGKGSAMTTVRDEFEGRERLSRVLAWDADDGTLSGGEYALVATLHALVEHFDRLDGPEQTQIAAALTTVAAGTTAEEAPIRAAHAAALRRAGLDEQ